VGPRGEVRQRSGRQAASERAQAGHRRHGRARHEPARTAAAAGARPGRRRAGCGVDAAHRRPRRSDPLSYHIWYPGGWVAVHRPGWMALRWDRRCGDAMLACREQCTRLGLESGGCLLGRERRAGLDGVLPLSRSTCWMLRLSPVSRKSCVAVHKSQSGDSRCSQRHITSEARGCNRCAHLHGPKDGSIRDNVRGAYTALRRYIRIRAEVLYIRGTIEGRVRGGWLRHSHTTYTI